MSYQTWTIYGYGFNVSQITNDLKSTKDYEFIRAVLKAIDKTIQNNNNIRDCIDNISPGSCDQIHDATYDDDLLKSIDYEKLINNLRDYEGNNFVTYGFDQLLIDTFDYLWYSDGHDQIQDAATDEFNDGSAYWLLGTVYPWHRCEFASMQDCQNTIKQCFGKIVEKSKFEELEITNGG